MLFAMGRRIPLAAADDATGAPNGWSGVSGRFVRCAVGELRSVDATEAN
jgi:hypothetical protein